MNQPQVLLAQRTHLDTRLCQRMCHLPTKQEPDTPTKDAPVQNSVRSCHRQVFSAHNNRIDWDKTCPYVHSRVDTLRKLSQRRLRRSWSREPFTTRKAAQALRGETWKGRGEMEKRLLIDRQETQLAVIRTQVGAFIYIQEKAPIRGYT